MLMPRLLLLPHAMTPFKPSEQKCLIPEETVYTMSLGETAATFLVSLTAAAVYGGYLYSEIMFKIARGELFYWELKPAPEDR